MNKPHPIYLNDSRRHVTESQQKHKSLEILGTAEPEMIFSPFAVFEKRKWDDFKMEG